MVARPGGVAPEPRAKRGGLPLPIEWGPGEPLNLRKELKLAQALACFSGAVALLLVLLSQRSNGTFLWVFFAIFVICIWLGSMYLVGHSTDRTEYDQFPDSAAVGASLSRISIIQSGFITGSDWGAVWCDQGFLCFNGRRISFRIVGNNVRVVRPSLFWPDSPSVNPAYWSVYCRLYTASVPMDLLIQLPSTAATHHPQSHWGLSTSLKSLGLRRPPGLSQFPPHQLQTDETGRLTRRLADVRYGMTLFCFLAALEIPLKRFLSAGWDSGWVVHNISLIFLVALIAWFTRYNRYRRLVQRLS